MAQVFCWVFPPISPTCAGPQSNWRPPNGNSGSWPKNSGEVIFQLDAEGTILWTSPSLTPTLGWLPKEWIGRPGTAFLVHRGETDAYRSNLEQLQQGSPLVIARGSGGGEGWLDSLGGNGGQPVHQRSRRSGRLRGAVSPGG
jgi:PAS domain-containing protein